MKVEMGDGENGWCWKPVMVELDEIIIIFFLFESQLFNLKVNFFNLKFRFFNLKVSFFNLKVSFFNLKVSFF